MFSTFRKQAARPMSDVPPQPIGGSENEAESDDDADFTNTSGDGDTPTSRRRPRSVTRIFIYGALPALVLLLAIGAGCLKWQLGTTRAAITASTASVRAASEGTVALLSYQPDTVDRDLVVARGNLTGSFLDAFTTLTNDVVIPAAKQQRIFSSATVPAAASVTATARHAVVLVFVNQTTTFANDPPTQTASSVKVTLDNVAGRWLISDFAPI